MAREGWIKAKLSDLGEWRSGMTPSKSNPAYWTNGTIPWVSPKLMKASVISGSDEHIAETAIEHGAASIIPRGSILIVVRSGILKHSVPVAVTAVDCVINQDLRALIPAEGIDAFFVAAQLRWRANEILSMARKEGVTVDSLDQRRLLSLEVDLASPKAQVLIAARLAELEDNIVLAEMALNSAPSSIQRLRASAANRLFLPRGAATTALPRSVRVKDLAVERVRTGLSVRGAAEPPGVPSIRLSALSAPIVDVTDVRYLPVDPEAVKDLVLHNGDILVSRGSGTRAFVGRASIVCNADGHTIFPDKAFRIRVDQKQMLPEWFLVAWNSPIIRERLQKRARTTAGIWMILSSEVIATSLLLPSIDQQRRDLARLATIEQQLDRIERKLDRARRLLERTRSTIYARAFSGQLIELIEDPSEASLLLETLMAIEIKPKLQKPRRAKPPTTEHRLDQLLRDWPKDGQTFSELRDNLLAPYEEIKEAIFSLLCNGSLHQEFDPDTDRMLLKVVANET
jgi:type I restriction enzyme S subunit